MYIRIYQKKEDREDGGCIRDVSARCIRCVSRGHPSYKMPKEKFFGLPVPVSASPVTVSLKGKALHVTQVAGVSMKGHKLRLEVETGDRGGMKFVLAILSEDTPQTVLDATFFENDQRVKFYATGSKGACLHLTGVMVTSEEGGEEEDYVPGDEKNVFSSMSDSSSEEDKPKGDRKRSSSFEDKKRKRSFEAVWVPKIVDEEDFTTPSKKKSKKKKKKSQNSSEDDDFEHDFHVRKSGLKLKVKKQGEGKSLTSGKKVRIHYKAMLSDGGVFDASEEGKPLVFRTGSQAIIKGVDEGVIGMKIGEIRQMIIPAELAYGEDGIDGIVPPNATLKFEVQRV